MSSRAAGEFQPIPLSTLAVDLLTRRPGWQARWALYKATQPAIARRRLPWVIVLYMGIWVASQHVAICPVTTQSIDAHLVLVLKGAAPRKGDLVAFPYGGQEIGGHSRGDGIVKVLAGIPGDRIERDGRDFFVNGQRVGHAKEWSGVASSTWTSRWLERMGWARPPRSVALEASAAGVIPDGFVYVQGTDKDALDSRYAAMGLVPIRSFLGRAIKLF